MPTLYRPGVKETTLVIRSSLSEIFMRGKPTDPILQTASTGSRPELAFPRLTDDMILRLRKYGVEETLPPETRIFSVGQRDAEMFVVLDGEIRVVVSNSAGTPETVATQGPGEFTGELNLFTPRHTLADGFTASECRLIRVSRDEIRRIMSSEGDIANLIMQAAIWRRIYLIDHSISGVTILGHGHDAGTIELRRFLTRNSYPHRVIDPSEEKADEHPDATRAESYAGVALPAILFGNGRILERPSIAQVADELGITVSLDPNAVYDVAVVGAGPAGLATAVYGASEGLSVLVVESVAPGGQAGSSSRIENYLGFPTGVSGLELATRAQLQAQKFGALMAISRDVVALEHVDDFHCLTLSDGHRVLSRSVVIASGARYSKLAVENYDRFEGCGIHYAATGMEATLCRNEEVVVVGGGNSAGQAAIFLSCTARHVHMLIRGDSLSATMSNYLIERIENSKRITLHRNCEIDRVEGDTALERVGWMNKKSGGREIREVGALFVMIGAQPCSAWVGSVVALDSKGFILTGTENCFENSRYATNVAGVYAVGDVRANSIKRVASAVGEGSVVVSDIHRYLAEHRDAHPPPTVSAAPA